MSANNEGFRDYFVGVDGFDQTQAEAIERIRHANGLVLVTSRIDNDDDLTIQVLALIPPELSELFAVYLAGITLRVHEGPPE